MRLLTGSARLAGIIGWPVAHSRSPRLHGAWLNRYGIDGAYVPLAVAPSDFALVIRALAQAGFAGCNVTIPHKEAAFAICDRVLEPAHRAGAVNTLSFGNGIEGTNTDGYGFIANLRAHGVNPAAGPALILGAGGAARAIAAASLNRSPSVHQLWARASRSVLPFAPEVIYGAMSFSHAVADR
ncbi:MAG: shikimate dehydrogenase, partial [Acidocella sp.]|nr:shikimate dehydrogenase [Acidocella sp.]